MENLVTKWNQISLVKRIIVGLVIGIILAVMIPEAAKPVTIFGSLFVNALKSIAPVLVFFLVMAAISQHKSGHETNMKSIIVLYLLGTFLAGFVAVAASFIFPVSLTLPAGAENGIKSLLSYGKLLFVLIGCMVFVALVVNPMIVFINIRKNPFPLVFQCLRESGITAFFTRSSAANIPVNMSLCEKLGLDKDTYSVSIPLGATINMAGAAVTISVLTLSAVNTLGIQVDMATALILSILSAVSACGASGVAGGSLLLIPLACSLFGIPNTVAMQVVGVGFIVGVLQDSFETALNSSTDALFTATAEFAKWRKEGKDIVINRSVVARKVTEVV